VSSISAVTPIVDADAKSLVLGQRLDGPAHGSKTLAAFAGNLPKQNVAEILDNVCRIITVTADPGPLRQF
jgi:hypothetical protein